jgi:2-polyprenyl-3-methyl-5-hydroxy-6-metoxy-1,4-benzoquinol methylase
MQEAIICPLCMGQSIDYQYAPKDLSLHHCLDCGIVFLACSEAIESYARSKEEEFFSADFLIRQTRWQRLFERHNTRQTLRRIQRYKLNGALLEIGIGSGAFLATARERGFDCTGIEASASIARYVQQTLDVPVFTGYLEEFYHQASARKFDVIVMNHVLEHIPDPYTALAQARELLHDKGILHLVVPNLGGWEARLSGWTAYEPYHLYYFSPPTLKPLLEKAMFEVSKMETVEPFSGWFNAVFRTLLWKRYNVMRSTGTTSVTAEPSRRYLIMASMLNLGRLIAGTITLPLRSLQARMHGGEELVCICTRK